MPTLFLLLSHCLVRSCSLAVWREQSIISYTAQLRSARTRPCLSRSRFKHPGARKTAIVFASSGGKYKMYQVQRRGFHLALRLLTVLQLLTHTHNPSNLPHPYPLDPSPFFDYTPFLPTLSPLCGCESPPAPSSPPDFFFRGSPSQFISYFFFILSYSVFQPA